MANISRIGCYYVVLLILLLSACTQQPKNNNKTVFRYNEPNNITSLDPAFANNQANTWAVEQLFNGLVDLNEQSTVVPAIAKKWDILNNNTTYRFHLRQDVFFHEDVCFAPQKTRRVTANDFVYSFNRILDKNSLSPGKWVFEHIRNFEALNDSTLDIHLKHAFAPFLSILAMPYCSVVPHEAIVYYGKNFRQHPVGTGAFQFKLWVENEKLVLVKNQHYFKTDQHKQPLPYLDAIAISFIKDRQIAFLKFLLGDFDFMNGIASNFKDNLLEKNGQLKAKYQNQFDMFSENILTTEYLGFNLKDTTILNKKLRKAINYGINKTKILKYLRNNIGTEGWYGFVPPNLQIDFNKNNPIYTYQPELAKTLIKQSKYKGQPITLHATPQYVDLCEFIQAELINLGLNVRVEINPTATHRELVAKGQSMFFRNSWIADYADAENFLNLFYGPNLSPKGPNYTHFKNKKYDELFQDAIQTQNDTMRQLKYKLLNDIINEEAPVVVLYYDKSLRLVGKHVKGLSSNPMNKLNLENVKISR